MTATLLLALGIVALTGAANALRPARNALLCGPSWLAAWITVELAPQLVLLATVAAAVLAVLGGLGRPLGVIGLGALLVADGVALPMILRSRRAVLDLGAVTRELDSPESSSPYPRREIAFPFLMLRRRGVRVRRGVEYAREGRLRLKLDVYMPHEPAEERRPAIVWVHGGAWVIGSRREQGIPLLTHLAANGWVGFNIDYRLSPRATWPDQIVDVKRAIAWVREHAGDYGVDPDFIAVAGGSAGGHLSALAGLTANDPAFQSGFEDADTSVAACVPFYGVYDFVDEDRLHLPLVHKVLDRLVFKGKDPEAYRAASPMHRIHGAAPPFFVVHGERDSLIDVTEARRFAERLREASDEDVLYVEMKGGQHAFDLVPTWRTVPVVEAIERFLATVRAMGRVGSPA